MDAIALLKKDHKTVGGLLDALVSTTARAVMKRRELVVKVE
ncbi:MAG: hypothetical protein ABIW82_04650 [Dokdonella sp.]